MSKYFESEEEKRMNYLRRKLFNGGIIVIA